MAVLRVQSASNGVQSAAPTLTLTSAPINGNKLIAVVGRDTSINPPVVDTIVQTGVTWTRRYRQKNPTNDDNQMEFWTGDVGAGAGTLITFNKNEAGDLGMIVIEYSGVASSGAFIDGISSGYNRGEFTTLSTYATWLPAAPLFVPVLLKPTSVCELPGLVNLSSPFLVATVPTITTSV